MDVLYLSGESLRNKDWIESVAAELKPLFIKSVIHYYQHWQAGSPRIDLALEQKSLPQDVQRLGAEYVVFAKSAGAVLTIKSINDGILRPRKCLFAGAALAMVKNLNLPFNDWLSQIDCPVMFIHNSNDPVGSFSELKSLIESSQLKDYQLVEWPGETHDYTDLAKLKSLAQSFIFG